MNSMNPGELAQIIAAHKGGIESPNGAKCCPFCGNPPGILRAVQMVTLACVFADCPTNPRLYADTEPVAIALWNDRRKEGGLPE